jgi:hypothetical protein
MSGEQVYFIPGDVVQNVGQKTTKKCSADKKQKERDFTCPMGSQYCTDDAPQQCASPSPVFPWVVQTQLISQAPIIVGQKTTKKCSADKEHKQRDFTCSLGTQYCMDDAPQQCASPSPIFPWNVQVISQAPVERPRVSLEAEICLKLDDSMCALKSQICAVYGADNKLCHMMDAVCKKH